MEGLTSFEQQWIIFSAEVVRYWCCWFIFLFYCDIEEIIFVHLGELVAKSS